MNIGAFYKRKIFIIVAITAAVMITASLPSFAASVPASYGQVNSDVGAILRKSSTTSSARLTVLSDNTAVTVHKEIFKSRTSTSAADRWYYVTAGSRKGYIRADLVDNIKSGSIQGVVKSSVNYRKGAGVQMSKYGALSKGTKITVLMVANPVDSTKGSSITWYKAKIGSKTAYVCSDKITLTGKATAAANTTSKSAAKTTAKTTGDAQFEKYMKQQGFPESYKPALRTLHKAHPKWVFVARKTNINWNDALAKQSRSGVSLVHKSYPKSYRNGNSQREPGWYNANKKVVAYYMDPRHFLNENSIYMFEDLSYKKAYQTTYVVNAILAPSKLPKYGFTAAIFVKAGSKYKISPVFLAARARQETGGGSDAIYGKSKLGRVYNPFNIGAFGGSNPLYNGLIYAKAKGWNTQAKAVEGGAELLAESYINKGQHTVYYQRFNVRNGAARVATHQYMTNIMAAYSESLSTRNSYKKYGVNKQPLVFEIPIYNGMPSSTKLP